MFKRSSRNYLKVITLIVVILMFGLILAACEDSDTKKFNITVTSNNTNYGTVTGGGSYKEGATATLKATPKKDHFFSGWYDGDDLVGSEVTYKFEVSEDLTLVGHFGSDATGITDINVFVATINNTFKQVVGLDTVMTRKYDGEEESINIKAHYDNGELTSAYLSADDYLKMWIKDGIQYNYSAYSINEFEVTKHTFDRDNFDGSFYVFGYMVQMLNELMKDDNNLEYEFNYDATAKLYILEVLSNDDFEDTIKIYMKVENSRLVETSFEIKYGELQSMTLLEKIIYDKANKPVLPAIGDYDYVEMFWLTQVAPTGDTTKYHSPIKEIPSNLYNEHFDGTNIAGYYYDEAFTKKANYGDILTKDTVIYFKLIDDEKIDFTIEFTNTEIPPIELKQVYKWQLIDVAITIPSDVIREDYIDSVYNQIRDLGIKVNSSSGYYIDKMILTIVTPNESKTITLD